MRNFSAPGARMKRSRTVVSQITTTISRQRAIRPCSSGGQSKSRKAPSEPSANAATQPRPNASLRPTAPSRVCDGVEPHRDQPLAEARGQAPVEPLDRDAECQEHRDRQQRGPDTLTRNLGVEQRRRPAPAAPAPAARPRARPGCGGAPPSPAWSCRLVGACWRRRCWRRPCPDASSHCRTSGSSISARSARTLSGGTSPPAGAWAATAPMARASSSPANIAMMDARTGIGLDPRAARASCAAAGVVYQRDR